MQYEVIEDAPILIPNASHLNFTESNTIIPKGEIVEGKEQYITGKRRGQPFKYRLFITKDKKIIHLNKVKPMSKTEIKLGADAQTTPTEVSIVSKKNISLYTIGGAGIGAYAGYYFSKKKGYNTQETAIVSIVCGIAGFVAGRQLEKSGIFIKKSK